MIPSQTTFINKVKSFYQIITFLTHDRGVAAAKLKEDSIASSNSYIFNLLMSQEIY